MITPAPLLHENKIYICFSNNELACLIQSKSNMGISRGKDGKLYPCTNLVAEGELEKIKARFGDLQILGEKGDTATTFLGFINESEMIANGVHDFESACYIVEKAGFAFVAAVA